MKHLSGFWVAPDSGVIWLAAALAAAAVPALGAQSLQAIATGAAASRQSGVAPLYVHFSSGLSDSGPGLKPFHELDYSWDFGDPSSGRWSSDGKAMNSARGPVAAHVYEKPGTYTATLSIRDLDGHREQRAFTVKVDDPAVLFPGAATVCVTDLANRDFSDAPPDAKRVSTDNLASIARYAQPGSRILLRRGCSWTVSGIDWPSNAGPVSIGAFGPGERPDQYGFYANAPRILVIGGSFLDLNSKQDWRVADLWLVDRSRANFSIGGDYEMRNNLFLRLKIEGFGTGLGWSHWNTKALMTIDSMAVVSCDISDSDSNVLYVGGERLALLGNRFRNARTSHVARVWQAYKGVISHNLFSGASLDNSAGRHALKLHGPGSSSFDGVTELGTPVADTGFLANRTRFCVVSDNVFGTSGPWPVAIGPQDAASDERLSDIIFERNRLIADYGVESKTPVSVALHIWARYVTVRNNVFDGTGSSRYYTGVRVEKRGSEPAPVGVALYNNSFFKADGERGSERGAIVFTRGALDLVARNNLIVFPGSTSETLPILDESGAADLAGNTVLRKAEVMDPTNKDPLKRDFAPAPQSPGAATGLRAPVYDDLNGAERQLSGSRVGALR